MTPDSLFQIAGPIAMIGWIFLALAPLAPKWADRIGGVIIPAILSVGYTAVILGYWWQGQGGFDSLANVMLLLSNPWMALAGWVHFLAFDLFIGGWITRQARRDGIPHLVVLPCLLLTFLFGPAGLILFLSIGAMRRLVTPREIEA
ncbi:ABA4-like family protein [Seohaeicola saemankumensis]|uniref:ABA4-like family protein n=1 Tax=Seohaeicola saemankumensis TaxID=481181 RepID=A0ABW3T9L1_9RHOB